MVKDLQPALANALEEAREKTSAALKVVVVARSDAYHGYMLAYGLGIGTCAALILWAFGIITFFPWLLLVQLGCIAACDGLHSLSDLLIRFVPKKIRHHQANRMAMRSYHLEHTHVAHDRPFVLLFVSKAERYVHVVTNPVMHRALPGGWEKVTVLFAQTMRGKGLVPACTEALAQIADILSASFPL